MSTRSIVEYFSDPSEGHECGYCHAKDTNLSQGMWAHSLSVQDYQDLIDRGWRRSGKYVYKPTMNKTCCPQYVIRCAIEDFKISKSHKKVIKRNNKYFHTGLKPCHSTDGCDQMGNEATDELPLSPSSKPAESHDALSSNAKQCCDKEKQSIAAQDAQLSKTMPKPGAGPDPRKPVCKKAKLRRMEKKQQKQKTAKSPAQPKEINNANEPKSLESLLGETKPDDACKLEVRLVRSSPPSQLFNETFNDSYQLYKKYQMIIHNDEADKLTERQYRRFLVDSPLMEENDDDLLQDGFGSFHQQYLLDGKLIAVGVMDILTHCTSSVYMYYDPDYSFLSIGTYSALREIAFTRVLHAVDPAIKYYYMGFYIHTCPKMKYKGQFSSSFLLCPESYQWFPLEVCSPKLDAKTYCRFDETGQEDKDGEANVDAVLCLHKRQAMPYFIYKAMNPGVQDADDVRDYASLTGMKCASRMLLYRAGISQNDDDSDD